MTSHKWLSVTAALLFILSQTLTGCRSHKESGAGTEYRPSAEKVDFDMKDSFDSITSGYGLWTGVKLPFTARIDGVKMSMSGTAYIVRDQEIYLSVRFLGMEVGVVSITPSTVTVVDKYHRIYLQEPVDRLTDIFPLTLGNIQDLLLGHCFIPGKDVSAGGKNLRNDMKLDAFGDQWTASPRKLKGSLSDLVCVFIFDNTSLRKLEAAIGDSELNVTYGDTESTGDPSGAAFASSATLSLPTSKKEYGGEIKWNLRKAEAIKASPGIKIPADCRRVDAAQLVKQLRSI